MRPPQTARIAASSAVSSAPERTARRSVPRVANRQVYSFPSAEIRARVHVPQKGCVTDVMNPTSPAPSR